MYTKQLIKNATIAVIGHRIVTEAFVLKVAQAVAPLCGYIHGVDDSLENIVNYINAYCIPDQIEG